jgi:uncharacterized protein YjbJ (UPF0337 family)
MKDQIEGTFKEQKGKLLDDESDVLEGKAQKQVGEFKDTVNDKLDDAEEALDRDRDRDEAS